MKFWTLMLFSSVSFCQTVFHNPDNRKIFADYLFCTKDYLRASQEYSLSLKTVWNDSSEFRLALALQKLENFSDAEKVLCGVKNTSVFYNNVLPERLKNCFLEKDYLKLRGFYSAEGEVHDLSAWKMRNFSYLYTETENVLSPPFLLMPFSEKEKNEISIYYDKKMNLPSKDPVLAGFLSALLPGLGKVYTEEYSDGFFAALATGVFGYIAYTSFKAHHDFRGYLFSGITAWFYGGNIYGAAASAQIFNARINFSFTSLLDSYLRNNNYFLEEYGFCK